MPAGESYLVSIIVEAKDRASKTLRSVGGYAQENAMHLQQVGMAATAVGGTIVGAMGLAAREAGNFESIMTDVQIQSGATAEEMERMKEVALSDSFVRLGKSGSDVANMLRRLASEGYEVVQMKQMLKPITETTVALGTEEAETTKLMLNLMQQYRMEASDMTHIGDVMASALANTSFQGQELAETMRMAGVAGQSLGWSLEETIAVTDQVVKVTGEASMAGRYFRSTMMAMRNPSKQMTDELARVGITADDVSKALEQGPIATIELLNKAHDRGANFAKMFSNVAITAAEALVDQEDAVRDVTEALGEEGAAHEAAMEKMKTAVGQSESARAAFSNLGQGIGEALLPAIRELGPPLITIVSKLADFARTPVGKVIVGITAAAGGLLAVLGPGLMLLGQIGTTIQSLQALGFASTISSWASSLGSLASSAIPAVTSAAGTMGTTFAALAANPITWVIAAIAALAVELYYLQKEYKKTEQAAREAVEDMREVERMKDKAGEQGYAEQATVEQQRAEIEAAAPTMGERFWGAVTPGMTAKQMAEHRVRISQADPVHLKNMADRSEEAAEKTRGLADASAAASDELAGHSLTTAAAEASQDLMSLGAVTTKTAQGQGALFATGTRVAQGLTSLGAALDRLEQRADQLFRDSAWGMRQPGGAQQLAAAGTGGNTYHIHFDGPINGVEDLEQAMVSLLERIERKSRYQG